MSKNAFRGVLIIAMLLALFSTIVFIIPFSRSDVFWIAYFCGVIAIIFQVYIFRTSFRNTDARSRFYGFPIARVGIIYLVIQVLVSLIEMALAFIIPAWVAIIINLLVLVSAFVGCITMESTRDEVERQDEQIETDATNMRTLQTLIATLSDQCSDKKLKNELYKLTEEFRFSDPLSSNQTQMIEEEMLSQVEELQQAIIDNDIENAIDLCYRLKGSLKERNRICTTHK